MSRFEDDAARWFVRMLGAAPDHPDRGRFEAWLVAHPAHAAEYAAFAATWQDLRSGANGEAVAAAMQARQAGRRQARRGVLGLLLAAAGAWALNDHWRHQPLWQIARRTGPGPLVRETLDDGSTLLLDAGADVAVTYTRTARRVELRAGQTIFDVTRDAERPFVVDAGDARITVLGTRFVLNRLADRVRVGVDHGRVEVAAGPFWRRRSLVLEAGQSAEVGFAADGQAATLQRESRPAADAFAFERGLLVFDQASLAEIAETLSRHRRAPVRAKPPASGGDGPRIVAAIHVEEVEGFIDLLPRLAPVAVSREGAMVWLRAR